MRTLVAPLCIEENGEVASSRFEDSLFGCLELPPKEQAIIAKRVDQVSELFSTHSALYWRGRGFSQNRFCI